MKYKDILFLIVFSIPTVILGQQSFIKVTGKVISEQTGFPMPYSTISISNRAIGTIANDSAEFIFNIPKDYENDTFKVSFVGYENYTSPVKLLLKERALIIKLKPKLFELTEVVVRVDSLTPAQIMEKVMENIGKNYPTEPFMLEGFYRLYNKENENYTSYLEAAILIEDEGYPLSKYKAHKSKETVFIEEIRKINELKNKKKNVNPLHQILLNNDIRYFKNAFESKFESVKRDYYDNRPVYILTMKDPIYSVVIDVESFALLKLRLERHLEASTYFEHKVNDSIKNKLDYFIKNLEFREFQGKLYLHYANYSFFSSNINIKNNKKTRTSNSYSELLINNILVSNFRKLDKKKMLNKHEPLESHLGKYNMDFWKNYNVIKESSHDLKFYDKLRNEDGK